MSAEQLHPPFDHGEYELVTAENEDKLMGRQAKTIGGEYLEHEVLIIIDYTDQDGIKGVKVYAGVGARSRFIPLDHLVLFKQK